MGQRHEMIQSLMAKMTIEEKIGQLYQTAIMGEFDYGPAFEQNDLSKLIKEGRVGSLIGPYDNHVTRKLQKLAVEGSRLGIPLMFDNDIIHGCRTGFPVNLALSGSFDPELVKKSFNVISYETAHSGTNVTLAPMLDIVRDPRWGRVVESPGEDPFLAEQMAKAYVKGWKGEGEIDQDHVGVCLKHFVGYGRSEAGRDYNHVDISPRELRQVYLKPFKAGIDSGADMVMTSFNVIDDVPVTANKHMLRDVLRGELGFKGVTISDYTSSEEIMNHKITEHREEVAEFCLKAGLDIELISTTYLDELKALAINDEQIRKYIDEACYRVLVLKEDLGLFDEPYKHIHDDFESYWLLEGSRKQSKFMAEASVVLLENNGVLPLNKTQKILLTGPFAKTDQLVGAWGGKVRNEDCITLESGLNDAFEKLDVIETEMTVISDDKIKEILEQSEIADVVVVTLGENQWDSGEAHSKTNINVYPDQVKLVKALKALGKKVVGIVFSGRPLVLTEIKGLVDGLLYAWFLGTETGDAIKSVLLGDYNPSARLAMTFPRSVGQIPIYYNHMKTGRPHDPISDPHNHYTSRYLDSPNDPLYPFGYGLSYSEFTYENIRVQKDQNGVDVIFDVLNMSSVDGYTTPQIYIEALSFSVTRPVNELKGFKKMFVKSNERVQVSFHLDLNDFSYYNRDMIYTHEYRDYLIKVGHNSSQIVHQEKISLKK